MGGSNVVDYSVMYEAQQAGVIVPFLMELEYEEDETIGFTPTKNITISGFDKSRYYEEMIILGRSETQYLNVTFAKGGTQVIQTFGNKDTYVLLLDSEGNIIDDDDDRGYSLNSWIQFTAQANVVYQIIVFYYNSNYLGRCRLSITPATGLRITGSTGLVNFNHIYQNSLSQTTILFTETELYQSLLYKVVPHQMKNLPLKT